MSAAFWFFIVGAVRAVVAGSSMTRTTCSRNVPPTSHKLLHQATARWGHPKTERNANESSQGKYQLGADRWCTRLHNCWPLIDVERNLITAEATDHAMDNGRDLTRDDISALIETARRNLCPDTL